MTEAVITRENIESILSNCEIGYWGRIDANPDDYRAARTTLGKDDPMYEEVLTEILYTDGALIVTDVEEPACRYVLTLDGLMRGINMAIDQQYCYDRTWWDVDRDANGNVNIVLYDDEMDGEACDCIIQLALFGDVIFG